MSDGRARNKLSANTDPMAKEIVAATASAADQMHPSLAAAGICVLVTVAEAPAYAAEVRAEKYRRR
jgi:hypothetical protein